MDQQPQALTPDQLMQMINGIAHNLQNLSLVVNQLAQQQAPAQGAPGAQQQQQPRVKFTKDTFPNLVLTGNGDYIGPFVTWEKAVRRLVIANADYANVGMPQLLSGILGCLQGQAALMTQEFNVNGPANMDEFMTQMRNLFCGGAVQAKAEALFSKRVQRPDENINAYHAELLSLFQRAYPGVNAEVSQSLINHFINHLHDKEVKRLVVYEPNAPDTYTAARNLAIDKAGKVEKFNSIQASTAGRRGGAQFNYQVQAGAQNGSRVEPMDTSLCTFCHKAGHTEANCWSKLGKPKGRGKRGGGKKEKSEKNDGSKPAVAATAHGTREKKPVDMSKVECHSCHRMGHYKRNCRTADVAATSQVNNTGWYSDEDLYSVQHEHSDAAGALAYVQKSQTEPRTASGATRESQEPLWQALGN
jgi:hypothetical protein